MSLAHRFLVSVGPIDARQRVTFVWWIKIKEELDCIARRATLIGDASDFD
jgi:hypothetical protein